MKKTIALLSAAVLIFGVAGCKNKQPDHVQPSDNSTAAEDSAAQESSLAEETTQAQSTEETAPPPSSTAVVVVTGGKEFGIQQPDVTSVIELVPTIAPPQSRPTAPSRPSTTAKPTTTKRVTTTREQVSMAKPTHEPELVYPDSFAVTENGATDSVRYLAHSCELYEGDGYYTFRITARFDISEYSGAREGMYIAYNCYDANGRKLNEKLLTCYIPLSDKDKTVPGYLSALGTTTRIELVNYY